MEVYLDTNVFVYALTDELVFGKPCRTLLSEVMEGRCGAVTSAFTFNETVFLVRKLIGPEASIAFAETFLAMPNLKIVGLGPEILSKSVEFIKKYGLQAGDAIHVATAVSSKCAVFYSADEGLKKVIEINLKAPK